MCKRFFFTLLLLFSITSLQGMQLPNEDSLCDLLSNPHRISIGPEFYYIERHREGDPTQEGWMFGERMVYERIIPCNIYYGAEQYYAQGCISAKFGCGQSFLSNLRDAEAEGRIGYTFLNNCWITFTVTPFIGYGDFHGTNKFIRPKAIKKVRFKPRYQYTTIGFLTNYILCDGSTSIGINVKWKFMHNAENKIEDRSHHCHCHDHHNKKHHHKCDRCDFICFLQDMGNKTLYQVDFPLTYHCWGCREQCFEFSIIPFIRNRKYGGKENCPFDFLETTFNMRGARILITYIF